MKQKSGPGKAPAEQVLKDIRRQTRRHYSAEEKIRIVLEGLRGEGTSPSSAVGKASPPRCITAGPRSSHAVLSETREHRAAPPRDRPHDQAARWRRLDSSHVRQGRRPSGSDKCL